MKKIILLILVLVSLDIPAQTVEWVKTFGGTDNDEGHKCAVDATGNFLFTGTFSDAIDFGDVTIESEGKRDLFLLKTDKDGKTLWAKSMGGDNTSTTLGKAIATDVENNVYVSGSFSDTLNIESQQFVAVNEEGSDVPDCFIAKYTSEGVFQWVKVFYGPAGDIIEEMNILGNQLVVVGSYRKTFDVLGNTFSSDDPDVSANYNPFIASFNLDGDLNWLNKVNCATGTCRAFDIDPNGNINIILEAKGSVVIKNIKTATQYPLKQSNPVQDNYLVQLNGNDGSLIWGNRLGSLKSMMGYAVETDADNNIYCGGLFQGELKLESQDGNYQKVNAVDKFDYYVCKYSGTGNLLWVDAQGDSLTEGVLDMVVNSKGSIYLAGYFINPRTTINGEQFTCDDGNEALLIKYNKAGEFQWAKQTRTTENSGYIYSMEMTPNDSIVLLGHFKGDGTFFDGETYSTSDTLKDVWYALIADPEEETTGVADFFDNSLNAAIYPNPANNYLYIRNMDQSDPIQSIIIYNVIGEIVYSEQNFSNELKTSNIPSGVYFVRIKSKNKQKIKQIIIQH